MESCCNQKLQKCGGEEVETIDSCLDSAIKETAHSYVPTDEDIFIYVGEYYQRLIFGRPIEYKEEEKEILEEFIQYWSTNEKRLPHDYSRRDMYRVLQGWDFDFDKTYQEIIDHHNFIKANLPVNLDGLDEYLQNGMVYFYKRDKHFRPIWIINVKKLVQTKIDDDTLLRVTLAVVEYTVGKI